MTPTNKKKASCNEGRGKEKTKRASPRSSPDTPARERREAHQRRKDLKNWTGKNSLLLTLGMTCPNRNCFAVDPTSGTAVYPASGVAVLLDTVNCKQLGYIHASTQSISCVNFSPNGHYILLGELGHMPAVRVWSKALDHQVAKFKGHEFGVAYAAFSGNMDLVVSIGTNHDGYIFVWSWPSKERISCNRFAEFIYAMSFSRTEPFFVTCGSHHIRFWYPDNENIRFQPDTLLGRSVIMKDNKTRTYVDVAFGSERSEMFVFSVTNCGLVCKINSQRQVTQFLKLHKTELTSVQARDDRLVVGTICGHVHFFNAISMQYNFSISVPVDASLTSFKSNPSDILATEVKTTKPRGKMYLGLDNVHKQLTAVLDNGDLCIWDIASHDSAQRKYFVAGHNKAVSSMDNCCLTHDDDYHGNNATPCDVIYSVAHDGTVRQWQLSLDGQVICNTTKALYTGNYDPRDPATCNTEVITVVKASEELNQIVIGDSKGVLTVYDAVSLMPVCSIVGHSRGITVLTFYISRDRNKGTQLLLSGGRDRLINVYDASKDFQVLNSLCLHSGSITALAMVRVATNLMLISSALDRNVIMSCMSKHEPFHFTPRQARHTTASVIDIRICAEAPWAVLGRGNAVLTIIDTCSFQSLRSFRACKDTTASLERLCLGNRGALLVTACSDRSINVLSVPQGLRLACLTGHASPVSGLVLTSDPRYLISSSRDGCIFLWELPGRARRRALHLFKLGTRKTRVKAKKSPPRSKIIPQSRSSVELSNRSDDHNAHKAYPSAPVYASARASQSSQAVDIDMECASDVLQIIAAMNVKENILHRK
ncbi:mitogen-activated protein kinase-binding protein 1 [Elysia marginata]|uniref:Mitogen-activated protein kinase-binding protein 1 n=1 Tax=Elysia marginata TaxID=1093978 RepID=A0AAV4K095_9GAST|nr:mitogen-activated protein kinase-binding protein 1 [Elysia marginata]